MNTSISNSNDAQIKEQLSAVTQKVKVDNGQTMQRQFNIGRMLLEMGKIKPMMLSELFDCKKKNPYCLVKLH